MPYTYQTYTWCDSCGQAIVERLLAMVTGEFPKYMGDNEESDCPQHCAAHKDCLEVEVLPSGYKIGALLSTSLTSDGVEYVREAVANGGEVAEFWRQQFNWIDFPQDE